MARRQRLLAGAPSSQDDVRDAERFAAEALRRAKLAHSRSSLAHERAALAHEHVASAMEALAARNGNDVAAARLRQDARIHRDAAALDWDAAEKDRRTAEEA